MTSKSGIMATVLMQQKVRVERCNKKQINLLQIELTSQLIAKNYFNGCFLSNKNVPLQ
jgi:hypothetical protein